MGSDTAELVSAILNAAWMVRHYGGCRTRTERLLRQQAVLKLGLVAREALNRSDDFEPLLAALVDGLRPRSQPPF